MNKLNFNALKTLKGALSREQMKSVVGGIDCNPECNSDAQCGSGKHCVAYICAGKTNSAYCANSPQT